MAISSNTSVVIIPYNFNPYFSIVIQDPEYPVNPYRSPVVGTLASPSKRYASISILPERMNVVSSSETGYRLTKPVEEGKYRDM